MSLFGRWLKAILERLHPFTKKEVQVTQDKKARQTVQTHEEREQSESDAEKVENAVVQERPTDNLGREDSTVSEVVTVPPAVTAETEKEQAPQDIFDPEEETEVSSAEEPLTEDIEEDDDREYTFYPEDYSDDMSDDIIADEQEEPITEEQEAPAELEHRRTLKC